MASAMYTRNITPEPPREKHEMTKKEKWKNWWDYHLWHVVIGIIAAALVIYFIVEAVSNVKPDYQIAIMTDTMLPTGISDALGTALEAYADDFNGDGKVVVQVNEYEIPLDTEAATVDANTLMANVTRLMADGQEGESTIFITNHPAEYAENYSLFAKNDGTTPETASDLKTDFGYKWSDCPVLTSLELGEVEYYGGTSALDVQDYLKDFYLFRRAYSGTSLERKEDKQVYYESSMKILDALTAK